MLNREHAFWTPVKNCSNHVQSKWPGAAREIKKCDATPPIAAMSLTFAAMALYAIESGGWRF
jgi:hypothetical protein